MDSGRNKTQLPRASPGARDEVALVYGIKANKSQPGRFMIQDSLI